MDEAPELPAGAVPARRTPEFTAETVPPALLHDHHTTAWAQLVVFDGTVTFIERTGRTAVATPTSPVVIVPDVPHRIEPGADARFAVQFFHEA